MDTLVLFQQFGAAILLGALVGLERERNVMNGAGHFAGLRTFALISLLGALGYFLRDVSEWLFLAVSVGVLALIVAAYVMGTRLSKDVGITSEVAAVLVYIVGILAGMGEYGLAVMMTVALLVILHFKDGLHKWAKAMSDGELRGAIQFLIVAFIVLPLLPNESFGPYGFFNPYTVWLMVVFISGISFLSYIAIRLLGKNKGIFVSGALAGFISSTALAFSFAALSKKDKKTVDPYVLAIMIASTVMFVRVLIEVAVVNRELLDDLLLPFGATLVAGILLSVVLALRKEKTTAVGEKAVADLKSPFALIPALKFGLLFALILFLTKFATNGFGEKGIYLTSVISGLMDVDAITISMASLAKECLIGSELASLAIVIGAITNTAVKAAIFMAFGGKKVARKICLGVAILIAVCGGTALL